MKKKLIVMLIACLCVVEAASVVVPLSEPVTVEAATKKASKKKKTPNLNKVYNAVKGAYGKDYTPNVKLSKDEVNARYGLKKEWYSGVVAELPMISVNADELVIVKAKDADSKKKIKNALKQYQKNLMENMYQIRIFLNVIMGLQLELSTQKYIDMNSPAITFHLKTKLNR